MENQGFSKSPQVIKTVQGVYPENPIDKYRTKCFVNEKLRIDAHRALVRKNRSTSNNRESQDSIKLYDGAELYVQDFKIQKPMIPYPVKGEEVTA